MPAGTHPWEIAVDSASNRIYLPNSGDGRVEVIRGNNHSTVPAREFSMRGGAEYPTHRAYVLNYASDTVTVVDTVTNRLIGSVPTRNDRR